MLIIFDLDDTLIDTSGSITPVKLEQALAKMVEAGLQVGDFQESLTILKRLDIATESASQTLLEFLEIINGDKKYFWMALSVIKPRERRECIPRWIGHLGK